MKFQTWNVHEASRKIVADPEVPVQAKGDVLEAAHVALALLESLGGIVGFFKKRRVKKAIEVLRAATETLEG